MFRNFKKELFERRDSLPGNCDKDKQAVICKKIVCAKDLDLLRYAHEKQHYHLNDRVLRSAIKTGVLPIVKYLITKLSPVQWINVDTRDICRTIVVNNDLEVLTYLVQEGLPLTSYIIETAACYGNLNIVKYALEIKVKHDYLSLSCAVESGREDIVEFLLEKGVPYSLDAMRIAIQKKNLSMIKFLQSKGYSLNRVKIDYTSLEIVHYLYKNKCSWDDNFYSKACYYKDYELIKYALFHNCPVNDYLIKELIWAEKIDLLEYIDSFPDNVLCWCYSRRMIDYFVEKGFSPTSDLVAESIFRASADVLQWALDQHLPLPPFACSNVRYQNKSPCLQIIHKHGGVLVPDCYYNASFYGNMEVLDYLRRNNCPWDIGVYKGAIYCKNMDVFLYVKKYFPLENQDYLYEIAIKASNRPVIFHLLSEKAPTRSFLSMLKERCLLDMVPYFLQNNTPYTRDEINSLYSLFIHKKQLSMLYHISRYVKLTPQQNKHVSRYLRHFHVLESYLLKELVMMCIKYI